MSEGVNVQLPERLQDFVRSKGDPEFSLFSSEGEYIRDLIRRDYDAEDKQKWRALKQELSTGMLADASEFLDLSAADVISEAKKRKAAAHGS